MRHKLTALVREYRMEWAVVTVILYFVAIPATFIIFPNNSLWLALLVLFSGLTASLTTLGDMLISSEDKLAEEEHSQGHTRRS